MMIPRRRFRDAYQELYDGRFLSDGYPDLEESGVEYFSEHQQSSSNLDAIFECLAQLIDLSPEPRTISIIGCGPNPHSVRWLLDRGWDAVGLEPVPGSAETAREFLGDPTRILIAAAERLPLLDNSQRVLVMESVLEHVDSPIASVAEAFRVLEPGGVLYVSTTNRHALRNGEFRSRFFQWFPAIVKESYVFAHLHYEPTLANFTPRPAVHWFCFSELCSLGRQVGFAQFYSPFDLMSTGSSLVGNSAWRRLFLSIAQRDPWGRALALTLRGEAVFMLKRPSAVPEGRSAD